LGKLIKKTYDEIQFDASSSLDDWEGRAVDMDVDEKEHPWAKLWISEIIS
jgi:hypothetical protein